MDSELPRLSMMGRHDTAEVVAVERASYSAGWPATAFERELTQNAMARYVVLRARPQGPIVGFAGLWLMVDEAHVVTVAVLPESRRRGYGRILVHGLIEVAIRHGMQMATLEVRESNGAAQALYREFGFYDVGERKQYYSDNHENAIIMSTESLASDAYAKRLGRLRTELSGWFPGINVAPEGMDAPTTIRA